MPYPSWASDEPIYIHLVRFWNFPEKYKVETRVLAWNLCRFRLITLASLTHFICVLLNSISNILPFMAIQTKPHFVKILRSGRTKLKDQTLMREMNYTHALEIIQDMWAEEQGQVEQKCLKHNYTLVLGCTENKNEIDQIKIPSKGNRKRNKLGNFWLLCIWFLPMSARE